MVETKSENPDKFRKLPAYSCAQKAVEAYMHLGGPKSMKELRGHVGDALTGLDIGLSIEARAGVMRAIEEDVEKKYGKNLRGTSKQA